MEKKYQVFISSTYSDLQDERAQIIQALLELDCIPTGMELFQAANDDQWSLIKRIIDGCDYFIVIIAGRYGTIHPTTQISYTEMEYKYAIERHIPTIGFLYKNPQTLPLNKSETEKNCIEKLNEFRKLVSQKYVSFWENSYELKAVVSVSLMNLIKYNPAIGWVRANEVAQFIQDAKIQDSDGGVSDEIMRDKFFKSVNEVIKSMGYYISVSQLYEDNETVFTLTPLGKDDSKIEYLFIDEDAYKNFFITLDHDKPQYINKEIINKSFDSPEDDAFTSFFASFLAKRFYEHFDIINRTGSIRRLDKNEKIIALGGECEQLNEKTGKYHVFYKNEDILTREDIMKMFHLPHIKRGKFLYDKVDAGVKEWIEKQ